LPNLIMVFFNNLIKRCNYLLTKLLRKLFFGFLDAEAIEIGFYHFNVALGEVDIGV